MQRPPQGSKGPEVGAVILKFGAGRGNRTPTLLPELDFESSASTNSAIPAMGDEQGHT
jgi:hypothetical protein